MSRRRPLRPTRLILLILFIGLIITILYSNYDSEKVPDYASIKKPELEAKRLAIVVPFRDRFDELLIFVPLLTDFLRKQNLGSFQFFIVNQSSKYRFNRGALANVGFILAKNSSDYIAIHDVDLIPRNHNLSYSYPAQGPYHLSSPQYHPQYNYSKYFGGILLISNEHYARVNGMSNRYFGWGLEDDEFYTRVRAANIPIQRPTGLSTNRSNTFLHFHYNRKRDTFKTPEQRKSLTKRDRLTGLNNISFNVTNRHELTIDGAYRCTVYSTEIGCDTKLTPWCHPNHGRKQLGE